MISKLKRFPKKTRNKKRSKVWGTPQVYPKLNYHELRIRGMSHKEAKKAANRSYFIL